VRSKPISLPLSWRPFPRLSFSAAILILLLLCAAPPLSAQTNAPFRFSGEPSCSSSSCHGGAGEKRNQCFIWANQDVHSRSFATLTTARSSRIADNLKIAKPTNDPRCTACHAPFLTVPAAQLSKGLDPTKGVSCENCHGPSENWLRAHTRPDFTHTDRVHAGMRDLDSLYIRANTCVACHQHVDTDLLQAGHPELIFELDGQAVTEHKHWREKPDWTGPKTWLIGQAVALREMSWRLPNETALTERTLSRWSALVWLLQNVGTLNGFLPADATLASGTPTARDAPRAQSWGDELAKAAAAAQWPASSVHKCLATLASTSASFRDHAVSQAYQARRAERLVLALDRLTLGLNDDKTAKRLDPPLKQLFKDAQSIPDFKPDQFAAHLEDFQKALAAPAEEK